VAGVSVGLLPQGWQVETRIGSRLLIPRKAQSGHTRDTRGRQEEVWRGKHWGGGGSLVRAGKPSAMVLMVGAGQLKRRHARAPKLHRARYTRTSVVRTARTVHKLKACEYLVRITCEYLVRITDSRICFLPFFSSTPLRNLPPERRPCLRTQKSALRWSTDSYQKWHSRQQRTH
jgi:hypothetical protein